MDKKIYLRTKAKDIRKNLNMINVSQNLIEKIRRNDFYIQAKNVMLFYPMRYEVNLLELLNDDKNFYFPKVQTDSLLVCPYCSGDVVKKSSMNIFEPCTEPVSSRILDLVIVPALMADKRGFRLGYGGGFYDRFLSCQKVKTICPVPSELLVENLPVEEFDIAVDIVIS